MKIRTLTGVFVLSAPALAYAELSVSTFGATNAAKCFEYANLNTRVDTSPCDTALKVEQLTQIDRWRTLTNRGIILNRSDNLNAALADFNTVIDENDEFAEAFVNRGNTWFLAGRLDDALRDYRSSLDFGVSKPWSAWYNIGLVFDAKKAPEAAQDAYRKSLELKPGYSVAMAKLQ